MAPDEARKQVELFIFDQSNLDRSQGEPSLPSRLPELSRAIEDEPTLLKKLSPSSDWRRAGKRVWSRAYEGDLQDNEAIYSLRRELSSDPKVNHVDIVGLPLDPAWERAKGGDKPAKRPIRLAVFDMDSTLIEQEVIDELARAIGKYEQVAEITERAMQGHLDFAGSLRERVALLRGLRHDIWDQIRPKISFAPGARELCRELKRLGVTMAVLSGGFTPLAEWVKGELGLDFAHANFLDSAPANEEFAWDHLNGRLVEAKPIVTAERKQELLLAIAKEAGIPLSEVLCVGDGANDLKMMQAVGEGGGIAIALKAKPKVQIAAPNKLNSQSMIDILYLLGYDHTEVDAAQRI